MAEVYEVEHELTNERLALKMLWMPGVAAARFDREYEAMIRLNHPNIARVFTYGVHEGQRWLTLELFVGTPIQVYAKSLGRAGTPRRTEEVVRVAHDLALAIDYVHRRGMVHRDLKSANVLVLGDGRVKLIDFGTARIRDAVERITGEADFVGTFAYAAPEQVSGGRVDHRADLYAFGVLLYRLLTGVRLFDHPDPREIARRHVHQAPEPPRHRVPTLPEELDDLVMSLLAKRPEERPISGRIVAERLERAAGRPMRVGGPGAMGLPDRLIGREVELAAIERFLDRAADAPGALALVTGPQGSGRNRLLSATEASVKRRGWTPVHWFVRRSASDHFGLARLLQQIGGTTVGSDESAGERVAAQLATKVQADGQPIVLLVAGLDVAEEAGARTLEELRLSLSEASEPVVVVATALDRADEPLTPLRRHHADAMRVRIGPLDVRAVGRLVGALLHRRPPPAAIARRVAEASGGLPAYVEEVVRSMLDQGLLRDRSSDPNRVAWPDAERWPIPVPREAEARLWAAFSALPSHARRLLEALSLAGGAARVGVLAGALERTIPETEDDLRRLALDGWIGVSPRDGMARFSVPLGAHAASLGVRAGRRRLLERRLAASVADEPAHERQAHLLMCVGRTRQAGRRAREWGLHHLSHHRPATALAVLEEVVPKLAEGGASDEEIAGAALLYGTCLALARPADPKTGRALADAQRHGAALGDAFQAEVHLVRSWVHRAIGHVPIARKQLDRAWELVLGADEPPLDLAVAIALQLAGSERVAGRLEGAAGWCGRARREAARHGQGVLKAHVDVAVAHWEAASGRAVDAERTARGAVAVLGGAGDLRGLADGMAAWATALHLQGRFSELIEACHATLGPLRDGEVPTWYVRVLLPLARCELALRRLGRAQEWVDELVAIVRPTEHLELRIEAERLRGEILIASGQPDLADEVLLPLVDRAGAAGLTGLGEACRAAWAEAIYLTGARTRAVEAFDTAVKRLTEAGDVPALVDAMCSRARALPERLAIDDLAGPLAGHSEFQTLLPLRLELAVAQLRWARSHGGDIAARLAEVRQLRGAIDALNHPMEVAALRLHPWARATALE